MSDVGEVRLVLFAAAREAAGCSSASLAVSDLATLLAAASNRFGEQFSAVLATSRVWVNGDEPADGLATRLRPGDEVAVLPPVSGG